MVNATGPRTTVAITAATHGAHRPPHTVHARYARPEAIISFVAASDPNHIASGSIAHTFDPAASRACHRFVW